MLTKEEAKQELNTELLEELREMLKIRQEVWIEVGKKEGIEEGKKKGELEGKIGLVMKLIEKRWPSLASEAKTRLRSVKKIEQLEAIFDTLLDANNKQEAKAAILQEEAKQELNTELLEELREMLKIREEVWIEIGIEKGKKEGIEEGELAGKREGKREDLLRLIAKRWPAILAQVESIINAIEKLDKLETLFDALLDASTEAEALHAIQQAR